MLKMDIIILKKKKSHHILRIFSQFGIFRIAHRNSFVKRLKIKTPTLQKLGQPFICYLNKAFVLCYNVNGQTRKPYLERHLYKYSCKCGFCYAIYYLKSNEKRRIFNPPLPCSKLIYYQKIRRNIRTKGQAFENSAHKRPSPTRLPSFGQPLLSLPPAFA